MLLPEGNKAARFLILSVFVLFLVVECLAWLGMTVTFAKILSGTWNGSRKGIGILNDELQLCRYFYGECGLLRSSEFCSSYKAINIRFADHCNFFRCCPSSRVFSTDTACFYLIGKVNRNPSLLGDRQRFLYTLG